MRTWTQTASHKRMDIDAIDPESIMIEDIACGLSKACRFNGQIIGGPYNVAEHSVHVSRMVPPEDALAGLLHDASEAYLADVASPYKHHPLMAGYRELEARLQGAIMQRFGLAPELPASVKVADLRMLHTEALQLKAPLLPDWTLPELPYPNLMIERWSCYLAERIFLARFEELGGCR